MLASNDTLSLLPSSALRVSWTQNIVVSEVRGDGIRADGQRQEREGCEVEELHDCLM